MSESTKKQAVAALLFLFIRVLKQELPWLDGFVHAKRGQTQPVVLSRAEVADLLSELSGTPHLISALLYGSGLRLLEALRLRAKDIDFDRMCLSIRSPKGRVDRVTVIPNRLVQPLQRTHSPKPVVTSMAKRATNRACKTRKSRQPRCGSEFSASEAVAVFEFDSAKRSAETWWNSSEVRDSRELKAGGSSG